MGNPIFIDDENIQVNYHGKDPKRDNENDHYGYYT